MNKFYYLEKKLQRFLEYLFGIFFFLTGLGGIVVGMNGVMNLSGWLVGLYEILFQINKNYLVVGLTFISARNVKDLQKGISCERF